MAPHGLPSRSRPYLRTQWFSNCLSSVTRSVVSVKVPGKAVCPLVPASSWNPRLQAMCSKECACCWWRMTGSQEPHEWDVPSNLKKNPFIADAQGSSTEKSMWKGFHEERIFSNHCVNKKALLTCFTPELLWWWDVRWLEWWVVQLLIKGWKWVRKFISEWEIKPSSF